MAISPFADKSENDVGNIITVVSASAGMDTAGFDKHRQGVSVRDFRDFGCKLIPYISSKGIPSKSRSRFDHEVEKLNFGQPKLFEDLDEKPSAKLKPFEDINTYHPVNYLIDDSAAQYPVVLLSQNWLNPGAFDGIIEPLAIRTKMSNASAEGPFVAHDIRAALMPNIGSELASRSTFILSSVEFEPRSATAPYFDSQDIGIQDSSGFFISLPGYSYPEEKSITPFRDETNLQNSEFTEVLTGSISQSMTDGLGYGIYEKSTTTGTQMRNGSYVAMKGVTGNQLITGVDSVAFGGLLK